MYRTAFFLLTITQLSGACTPVSDLAKEAPVVTLPTDSDSRTVSSGFPRPQLTVEVSVTRLLALLRNSRDAGEFTPERLSEAFGVAFQSRGGEYSHGEAVSPRWAQNLEFNPPARRLRFGFDPLQAGGDEDMADVCYELERVATQLAGLGFRKEELRGEHGRLLAYRFERIRDGVPEMRVEVAPQGEHSGRDRGSSGRMCVRSIEID